MNTGLAFSYAELKQCADRELALRLRVYPDFIRKRKISQDMARKEIAKMRAIVEHFGELAEKEGETVVSEKDKKE